MRQWACVAALLLGLVSNGYVAAARFRVPVPIERRLDSFSADRGTRRTLDWWLA